MAYFGVYRGVVLDNSDPQISGRVKVSVEGRQSWALSTLDGLTCCVSCSIRTRRTQSSLAFRPGLFETEG